MGDAKKAPGVKEVAVVKCPNCRQDTGWLVHAPVFECSNCTKIFRIVGVDDAQVQEIKDACWYVNLVGESLKESDDHSHHGAVLRRQAERIRKALGEGDG